MLTNRGEPRMISRLYGILPGMLILLTSMPLHAQDVSVTISEATVNQLLVAIGPVKGKGKGAQNISYSWTVTEPRVAFTPGAAAFQAKIRVKAKGITLNNRVKGKLQVSYDKQSNKIKMRVVEAKFPIKIKLFGKTFKVATVDISKYYQPKFDFNGPEPVQKEVTVDVGGPKPRIIEVTASGHTIRLQQDALTVSVSLAYAARASN